MARTAREAGHRLGATEGNPLLQFAMLAERCTAMSAQAARGHVFLGEDADFLNGLDKRLKQLTGREDGPVVVDFHTDPNSGQVVQAALGMPQIVEVTYSRGPSAPESSRSRGALFGVHQFKQPLVARLDDEAWAGMVRKGEAPELLIRADWHGAGAAWWSRTIQIP